MDASNLLKPALASGDLRCIGSTTYQEYKRSFDRDKALARRFQRIEVAEPTREEAVQILNGLKSHYEKHHNVRYTSASIRSAVELSARYINDRYLPDKADSLRISSRKLPKCRRHLPTVDDLVVCEGPMH